MTRDLPDLPVSLLDRARVPAGPPVAPLAVAAFALADERFGPGIGPLEPARAVR